MMMHYDSLLTITTTLLVSGSTDDTHEVMVLLPVASIVQW